MKMKPQVLGITTALLLVGGMAWPIQYKSIPATRPEIQSGQIELGPTTPTHAGWAILMGDTLWSIASIAKNEDVMEADVLHVDLTILDDNWEPLRTVELGNTPRRSLPHSILAALASESTSPRQEIGLDAHAQHVLQTRFASREESEDRSAHVVHVFGDSRGGQTTAFLLYSVRPKTSASVYREWSMVLELVGVGQNGTVTPIESLTIQNRRFQSIRELEADSSQVTYWLNRASVGLSSWSMESGVVRVMLIERE